MFQGGLLQTNQKDLTQPIPHERLIDDSNPSQYGGEDAPNLRILGREALVAEDFSNLSADNEANL